MSGDNETRASLVGIQPPRQQPGELQTPMFYDPTARYIEDEIAEIAAEVPTETWTEDQPVNCKLCGDTPNAVGVMAVCCLRCGIFVHGNLNVIHKNAIDAWNALHEAALKELG